MKKTIFILAFISLHAQAQTVDEYMAKLQSEFKPVSAINLVCGELVSEITVHGQEVTLSKSSKNLDFDNEALFAAKHSLDKSFVGWIQFPISSGVTRSCPTMIDFGEPASL